MDEFLTYRRSLQRESLKGDFIKSNGERIIANTLFEHGVPYRYEWNGPWDWNYRPDFTIPNIGQSGGIIIEYFGMSGTEDYDDQSDEKRSYWSHRPEWTFLEFQRTDLSSLGEEGFVDHLLQRLTATGVSHQRLSEEEIWSRIKERSIDRFTQAMKGFIARCGMKNLQPGELDSLVSQHTPCSKAEYLFLQVAIPIYAAYRQLLHTSGQGDFNELLWRAVSHVRSGATRFVRNRGQERGDLANLRFVMIDEFQDFSQMFFELIDAIRSQNVTTRVFCVGDDWQAINGFAGSDLRFLRTSVNTFRSPLGFTFAQTTALRSQSFKQAML
jgi:DNA helicase-4